MTHKSQPDAGSGHELKSLYHRCLELRSFLSSFNIKAIKCLELFASYSGLFSINNLLTINLQRDIVVSVSRNVSSSSKPFREKVLFPFMSIVRRALFPSLAFDCVCQCQRPQSMWCQFSSRNVVSVLSTLFHSSQHCCYCSPCQPASLPACQPASCLNNPQNKTFLSPRHFT